MPDDKHYRKTINAWCMYDWANSSFATTILSAVFPIYFVKVAGASLPGNLATAYWGDTRLPSRCCSWLSVRQCSGQ
jgi:UMF1 family MFS transporter